MMLGGVRVRWSAIADTTVEEWLSRFVYGGIVTALVGWISRRYGPVIGGLFLAFPSIVPASLTFAKRYGGTKQAVDEARGAEAGGAGLAVFALVVWLSPSTWAPALVLGLASIAWLGASAVVWRIFLS